ncbi:glycosyltransferase family 9 protein [Panacibacter ginsenosidivorans]|uniref:Glycosyltransferase family 9 protein n=1 Tax=Panacibacter ginsenosidivorans TaxID=1813871 RepID=A0A5B8V8N5_9BACT|nr:glycosyltransferase family 9 protein [Panacibacter ginsenosidivorans]QEC67702.1 glycosyltransferase family 9 protein [Panacibacter ginsenosidivorans]
MQIPENILISRTDSIGDVVLTLPVAAILKKHFPKIKIGFIGKAYTKPVINACKFVDEFIDIHDFMYKKITICNEKPQAILHVFPVTNIARRAKQLRIPIRIGTTNRLYHWTTCNKLIKLGRKNSDLHEAQLNIKLLEVFGINDDYSLQEIAQLFGLKKLHDLEQGLCALINKDKYNLILHPHSQGSAREWGLKNFAALIQLLDKSRFNIFISGTKKEREQMQPLFDAAGEFVTDITGMMNLDQFISFINACDGIVSNSTGPLHIAAALNKDALGIYPPMRPIHPGRWAPLGARAQVFVLDKDCMDCKNNKMSCHCITEIQPLQIKNALDKIAATQLTKAEV